MLTGILLPKVRGALNLTEATETMLKNHLAALQSDPESTKPQRDDILGKLFDISRRNGKKLDFVLDDIKMESSAAFFAGGKTTAFTLSRILYNIFRNRLAYSSLTAEIDAAVDSASHTSPTTKPSNSPT
ncbi:hypothetical protein BJX76DRAFT_355652 [Aspergillus varians]